MIAINVAICLKLKEKIVTLETFFDKIPGIMRGLLEVS